MVGAKSESLPEEAPEEAQAGEFEAVATPEETWIREFVAFYGTNNVTRFFMAELQGVSLTRTVEALRCGFQVSAYKCDGPGCVCIWRHQSDDDLVEIEVFFDAGEYVLEIRKATVVMEMASEPNAA